ncbi:MAG: DUF3786 domain-containing protein [Nitrospiraceae bacterium]|nr:DUF3786 domain-containing protein [Nitrospiraceae bacterium]
MIPGLEKAWDMLQDMGPDDVCRRAQASFDGATRRFTLRSFGMDIHVSPADRAITSDDGRAEVLLKRLSYFSGLSVLWYLVSAREIPLSGRVVQPSNLKGGDVFFRGTHVLPLEQLAERYGRDVDGFIARAKGWGGEERQYGDAAFMLYPLPRIPVALIMWREDEEFPARADLLFDSSCASHVPLDILWSIAMMSILIHM